MAGGIAVMAGWIFDLPALKSLHPQWVTMKFTTAMCFVFSGLSLWMIARALEGDSAWPEVVLPIAAMGILLIMGLLLASNLLGVRTGMEDLFIRETSGAVKTTTPGRPSLGTMVEFILIAASTLVTLMKPLQIRRYLTAIGGLVALVGVIAVVGYTLNQPLLYYAVPGFSTAMALHTALLFVVWGSGLLLAGRAWRKDTT